MSEQRLIDANEFLKWLDVGHLRNPAEICLSEINVKNMIDLQPTIDPETLPIVRELQAQVKEQKEQLSLLEYWGLDRKQVLKSATEDRASCECCAYGCKNLEVDHCFDCGEKECRCRNCLGGDCWEWRGLVAKNATAESEAKTNERP